MDTNEIYPVGTEGYTTERMQNAIHVFRKGTKVRIVFVDLEMRWYDYIRIYDSARISGCEFSTFSITKPEE